MAQLEDLVSQVWSPSSRPLVEEAWRCYNSGAIRASIAATWTAVTADIITKLTRLADDGDNAAVPFRDEVARARDKGLTRDGVRAMQAIETALLDKAAGLELIDAIGVRELERIREDRNLCVHPSLRGNGDVYEPRPEVARGHLAVALTTLLTHPPIQGGKVLEAFTAYICDPLFVPTLPHIQTTFFDRVRVATRRTLVRFAAKHAILELDPSGQLPAAEHADRMAAALRAFAGRDRALVREAVAEQHDKFHMLGGGPQLRALARLGDEDYFWSLVDESLTERLRELLVTPAPATWEPLPVDVTASLALVRSLHVRERLPDLESRFNALSAFHRMSVVETSPDPYFVPTVVALLKEAGSYRTGERAGRILVQHAPFLSVEALRAALEEWYGNGECLHATEMPEFAVQLSHGTTHLGPVGAGAFVEFLSKVQSREEPDSYYSYPGLDRALRAAGHLPPQPPVAS
ncbi:hypothetical protein O7628_13530 [Micromonospora sp. WMMD956]|uniref:hypothetical protein n=1 Tax=Micromonospora sp. WMMD956 TaxID=3016108 RepID=UPI002415C4E4|nr:hypothetical protein [Micromonospora sp. WMMD956]MDG4816519.1 hypothetical protein [Micromonospora sp. WMMD956]